MFRQVSFALLLVSAQLKAAEGEARLTMDGMEGLFARSDKARQESMNQIASSMSVSKAAKVLEKSSIKTHALVQATELALGKKGSFRKQPKGYSGLDGARKLLNDFISEAMGKYDMEISKCTDFYSKQCAAMEVCRGHISESNYIAANSRALILDSQGTINRCEVDIPARKQEVQQHLLKCKHELGKLNDRLRVIMGDIEIMTMILKMTDCSALEQNQTQMIQMEKLSLLRCTDMCTKKSFMEFKHDGLQEKINKLQSTVSQGLFQNTFADLFEGIEDLKSATFLQTEKKQKPLVKKTDFNIAGVPSTQVPANPCDDPDEGAPSATDKRTNRCTLNVPGNCEVLNERFLLIQAGIQDERDEIKDEIAALEQFCKETRMSLERMISNDETMLDEAQNKLAMATEKEANAEEEALGTAREHERLNGELQKQMSTCTENYKNLESEICALKKIRGELYKMKGEGHSAFFQDCEVSKWEPEECMHLGKPRECTPVHECDDFDWGKCPYHGEQKLTRTVLTPRDEGAKCLPTTSVRTCNAQPCPISCELHGWSGWSKCSAECGGGVQQRLREVKRAAKYGGDSCGGTSQTRACNIKACEKDCELGEWTQWTTCSKDCDGGTMKRQRFVAHEPEGDGKCPGAFSSKRLEFQECNMERCPMDLTCNKTLDIVLLLDGSGSLGKEGWKAEIIAANRFIDAFSQSGGRANMAVILFSGPWTWRVWHFCAGENAAKYNIDPAYCGVKTVTHFTTDLKKVKDLVNGLTWPRGGTMTSLALLTAEAELTLGRPNAHANVIVFTDGWPYSPRKTTAAAKKLRKSARLLWVAVTKWAPRNKIKKWATFRWEENSVFVPDFKALKKPDVITHIVADICPKETPKLEFRRSSR